MAFCLISSTIYLINDCLDVDADRAHPIKSKRPIAAGLVSVAEALATAALLAVLSLSTASAVSIQLAGVILVYGLIQLGYCLQFKRIPLLDLLSIASGFLLRASAGGVAADIPLSPWFLLTVGLLALFLAIEKRKAELRSAQNRGVVRACCRRLGHSQWRRAHCAPSFGRRALRRSRFWRILGGPVGRGGVARTLDGLASSGRLQRASHPDPFGEPPVYIGIQNRFALGHERRNAAPPHQARFRVGHHFHADRRLPLPRG